jgi:hypothetical protein
MATDDPVARIYGQIAGSKTAISETPVVLLIFKTLAARHLERWFHKRLQPATNDAGSEWFYTNHDELVNLFQQYLRTAMSPADVARNPIKSKQRRAEIIQTSRDSLKAACEANCEPPRRATGQHRRDASGKTAKDHVLLLWVETILSGGVPAPEAWSQKFGVEARTIRSWMSCWRNYCGTTFTGKEGWPRITHSVLYKVVIAIKQAKERPC